MSDPNSFYEAGRPEVSVMADTPEATVRLRMGSWVCDHNPQDAQTLGLTLIKGAELSQLINESSRFFAQGKDQDMAKKIKSGLVKFWFDLRRQIR